MSDLPQCLVTSPSFQDSLSTVSVLALCPLLEAVRCRHGNSRCFNQHQQRGASSTSHWHTGTTPGILLFLEMQTLCVLNISLIFSRGNFKKKNYLRSSGHKGRLQTKEMAVPSVDSVQSIPSKWEYKQLILKTWLRQWKALNIFQLLGTPR